MTKTEKIMVRIDAETAQRIREAARGGNRSDWLRRAIDEQLKREAKNDD